MSENKDLNIYQKIAVIQDLIVVKKDSYNSFGKFKFRDIGAIYSELKPILKTLNLIVRFKNLKLNDNKLSLTLQMVDTLTGETLEETGEIYIDLVKAGMDMSQKCLTAETFLKKRMLEDLFLINEEDPDSHNNTGKVESQISDSQLKRLYAIIKSLKIVNTNLFDEMIKKYFNVSSKKDMSLEQYNNFTEYLSKNKLEDILAVINKKNKTSIKLEQLFEVVKK